ncbi:MAG: hypothetical protein DRJ42_16035 [Deltaproteobacteria bacterium]|nr:MAG: hypothetical protein DRJ42_16035 [Deltaproteobacteria bacterium]
MTRLHALGVLLVAASTVYGCGDDATSPDGSVGMDSSTLPADSGTLPDGATPPGPDVGPPPVRPPSVGFPDGNEWSWDGSWTPASGDFPLVGLFDNEYHDGHDGSPVLPPGEWDWNDSGNDLANWRNFETNLGTFEAMMDGGGNQYGWRLVGASAAVDYQGPAEYFEGSSGVDYMDLGPNGSIHSIGGVSLGAGPDVLIFDSSYSLDFATGTTMEGGSRDDDLVIAGCHPNSDGAFDIETSTIHTGPGHDWVFVRDISRAAIDLGNGNRGRTDTLDPSDGDDLVVLRGNTQDFRVFGGQGDDVFVWFVDDNIQSTRWLGPNFFGGGGWEPALFTENGNDRLVLAIPTDTTMVTSTPTPTGGLLVLPTDGGYIVDAPTVGDELARYCVECGTSSTGEKTIILEYNSADGMIETGYFYLTGVEEVQVGLGEGAAVYSLDTAAGTATRIDGATLFVPPVPPPELCE